MSLFFVFVCLSYFIKWGNGQTVTFTIGVQSQYFDQASRLMQSSKFSVINFAIPNIINYTSLSRENISAYDFILAEYSTSLVLLTNIYKVPYLVIPQIEPDISLPSNVFYISSVLQQSTACTSALVNRIASPIVAFIDFGPDPQFQTLVNFNNLPDTLFIVNNMSVFTNMFVQLLPYDTVNVYICSIPLSERTLIVNLLNEALLKGQLNPRKLWVFTRVVFDDDFSVFQNFTFVGGSIFGYTIQFNSQSALTFQQMVVNDFLLLINSSMFMLNTKPANLSAQLVTAKLTNGILSSNATFDPITNMYLGISIIFKRVVTTPITEYTCNSQNFLTTANPGRIIELNNSLITVRIGVTLSKAYFMQKPTKEYYGYSVAFLNALQNLTRFKYEYVVVDNKVNRSIPIYQVLNSLLINNEVDIILIPMAETLVTASAFKSDPVLSMTMNILTRAPDIILQSITLAPFSYNVWLGILLIIILMTLGFWAVSALSPPVSEKDGKKTTELYSFGYCLLVIYSSFVMAKLKVKLLQPSIQIFAFILWFSTLTIIITYTANLMPYLMKTNAPYPFTNAFYFVNRTNTNFKWAFVNNSEDIYLIQRIPALASLYNMARSQWPNNMFVDDLTSESILLNNLYILIQNSYKNSYIFNTLNCTSDVLTGTNDVQNLVFAMNNNWRQKDQMKALIASLISSGVAGSLSIVYFGQGPCARASLTNKPSPIPLTLNKLFVLFMFVVLGCAVGVGFVLIAVVCNKLCRCIKNMKREPFLVGQKYLANVSSIENNGVWAFIHQRDRPYYIHTSSLHPDLRKQYSPKELEIGIGDTLQLKYFGKDPVTGYKRFCKDFTEA